MPRSVLLGLVFLSALAATVFATWLVATQKRVQCLELEEKTLEGDDNPPVGTQKGVNGSQDDKTSPYLEVNAQASESPPKTKAVVGTQGNKTAIPSIAIVTILIAEGNDAATLRQVAELTLNNKLKYAARHGYAVLFSHPLEVLQNNRTKWPVWAKLLALQYWLPHYDWLVWVDADAQFMNFTTPIESLIDDEHDIVVTNDHNGLNNGVFLLRNSEWSSQFLSRAWALYDTESSVQTHWGQEQYAMQVQLERARANETGEEAHTLAYSSKCKVVPPQNINAYPGQELGNFYPTSSWWHPGDYIVHTAGLGSADKLKYLTMYEGRIDYGKAPPTETFSWHVQMAAPS